DRLLDLQQGAALAAAGAPEIGVPACASCHGPSSAPRDPAYPSLAGQPAGYIARQLVPWQGRIRGGPPGADIMAGVADAVSAEQIGAVALYYAALDPDAPRPAPPGPAPTPEGASADGPAR